MEKFKENYKYMLNLSYAIVVVHNYKKFRMCRMVWTK
jgi:hypothetical protein